MSEFLKAIRSKSTQLIVINLALFAPMWGVFLLNHYVLGDFFNHFGIHPRDVSLADALLVCTSWMLHGSYSHIVGNTSVLFPLVLMVGVLEKNPLKPLTWLIVASGGMTWLLGSSASIHIGASGLVFALFGYVIASLLIGRNYLYALPVAVVAYFYSQSIFQGLIPQADISFAAHFGGFLAGLCTGSCMHQKTKSRPSSTLTQRMAQKYDSLLWKMKYKLKRLK